MSIDFDAHPAPGRFGPPCFCPMLSGFLVQAGNAKLKGDCTRALEQALTRLEADHRRDTITEGERHELCRLLLLAHHAAKYLMPAIYERELIDIGFHAAVSLTVVWATDLDQRKARFGRNAEAWVLFLSMFQADVQNMNRQDRLRAMPQPIMLHPLAVPDLSGACELLPYRPRQR